MRTRFGGHRTSARGSRQAQRNNKFSGRYNWTPGGSFKGFDISRRNRSVVFVPFTVVTRDSGGKALADRAAVSAALVDMGGFDVSEALEACAGCLGGRRCGWRQRRRQARESATHLCFAMLQDLLPAEIASSRKPGPAPMRRGGSLPKSAALDATGVPHAQQAALQPCSVDGVPDNVVDAWFWEADKDGDGRVADSEARTFFLTSGLAPADLSKVRCWRGWAAAFCRRQQTLLLVVGQLQMSSVCVCEGKGGGIFFIYCVRLHVRRLQITIRFPSIPPEKIQKFRKVSYSYPRQKCQQRRRRQCLLSLLGVARALKQLRNATW